MGPLTKTASTSDSAVTISAKKPMTTMANNAFMVYSSQPSVDIEFEDIVCTVPLGFRKGKKEIHHEISGKFPAGNLTAIIGPSGAGKSKLLDVLSGYKTQGVLGNIYTNGVPRNLNLFRKYSCYIPQDDRLQPLLTTEENMQIVADLKQPSQVSRCQKDDIINEILRMLNLEQTKDTLASKLSGGERKRLSIALELVTNPMVMFLDEPTTGLDSSSCSQCIQLLKHLARQGRTIVCTLHQPTASLLELVDQVYVLSNGNCVYHGATQNLVQFLADVNCPCPYYHNPADYIIELASEKCEFDKIHKMVVASGNGKALGYFNKDTLSNFKEKHCSPINKETTNDDGSQRVSSFNQLKILLKRCYIKTKRDKTLTYLRFMVCVFTAFLLGALFWQSGWHGAKILENYQLLFVILMYHLWSSMTITILTFPSELPILAKEHFNRWYSLRMYYTSITLFDIPVNVASGTLFSIIVYLMTGQPLEPNRFFMFFVISLLVSCVAQSFGLMMGAIFNVTNGIFCGTLLSVPVMMFAGWGILPREIPSYLYWVTHFSYMKYGFEGIVGAMYGYSRSTIYCPEEDFCLFKYPKKFLEAIDIKGEQFSKDVMALTAILLVFKMAAYVLLKNKLMSVR